MDSARSVIYLPFYLIDVTRLLGQRFECFAHCQGQMTQLAAYIIVAITKEERSSLKIEAPNRSVSETKDFIYIYLGSSPLSE